MILTSEEIYGMVSGFKKIVDAIYCSFSNAPAKVLHFVTPYLKLRAY
jgi:hypothetical protein